MNEETTANPAGGDDTRPEEVASIEAGAGAFVADDDMIEPPEYEEGEDDDVDSGDDDDPGDEDATAQVDYEGKLYEVPRELKDALLRQADYTRKTMELADQRRALAADQAEYEQSHAMTIEEFQTGARLQKIEADLAVLTGHDWSGVDPRHPDMARVRAAVDQLAQEKAALQGALTEHFHHKTAREQQETARMRADIDRAMAREIQDWSPARRQMLESFAVSQGIPEEHMATTSPAELRILHLAHIGAQQMERQRAANRGAYRPAAEVGSSAGAGPSDPARMSMAQYRAWRAKQK